MNADTHRLFHTLWTHAVGQPGYDKQPWMELDNALHADDQSTEPVQPEKSPDPALTRAQALIDRLEAEATQLRLDLARKESRVEILLEEQRRLRRDLAARPVPPKPEAPPLRTDRVTRVDMLFLFLLGVAEGALLGMAWAWR